MVAILSLRPTVIPAPLAELAELAVVAMAFTVLNARLEVLMNGSISLPEPEIEMLLFIVFAYVDIVLYKDIKSFATNKLVKLPIIGALLETPSV
jgi:hypothetical protein